MWWPRIVSGTLYEAYWKLTSMCPILCRCRRAPLSSLSVKSTWKQTLLYLNFLLTSSVDHIWLFIQCPKTKNCFSSASFFALRNDNQNASHSHNRYGNGKGRFKTKCIWDLIEILLTIAEIFNPTCQEKNVRFFFGWVYLLDLKKNIWPFSGKYKL